MGGSRFVDPYQAYVRSRTDACPLYSEVLAHTVLGLACGRGVGIAWALHVIYPLLWVVLVGPPSSRKTTALRVMERVGRLAMGRRFLPGSVTPEGVMEELTEEPVQMMLLPEMITMLGLLNRDYMRGVEGMLMTLHDAPLQESRRRAKDKGRVVVMSPGLAVAGALTPDGFQKYGRGREFGTGFLSRFVYVMGSRPKQVKPDPGGPDMVEEGRLAGELREVMESVQMGVRGGEGRVLGLSAEARDRYAAWSVLHERWVEGLSDGFQSCGVKAGVLPLRLAVTTWMDRGGVEAEIPGWAVEEGIRITERVRSGVEALMVDTHSTREGRRARTVFRTLQGQGGLASRGQLLRNCRVRTAEMGGLLETLRDAGLVKRARIPVGRRRDGQWWEVTDREEGSGGLDNGDGGE